jgi:hypothetical protein
MRDGDSAWPKMYSAAEAPQEVLGLVSRLMPLLLASDNPTCAILRNQYARSTILQVKLTGVGFFVDFEIPADAARTIPGNFVGGGARIAVEGVEHGAGCLLFVRDGALSVLEGFTYADAWREHAVVLDLRDAIPIALPNERSP